MTSGTSIGAYRTPMRVVAGSARGRRLLAPGGDRVRPTADRVREATFNALGSLDLLEDARVLDLFAGSGALGIEALSRGAAEATFVDEDRRSLEAVRANLAATGLAPRATVVRAEALTWLGASAGSGFDVALVDPPYRFERWPDLLALLRSAWAVVESDRPPPDAPGWRQIRSRRYRSTVVTFLRRQDADHHGEE